MAQDPTWPSHASPAADPGSFRDPSSSVFYAQDGSVLRGLSADATEDWRALAATKAFADARAAGRIVATEEIARPAGVPDEFTTVLRHERIPFVSYPYEWTFSMLRDAALLQLDLLEAALLEDVTMKDATPYNVQWRGTQPTFIDLGSFERLRPGEPWIGYRQFCQLFLYPLLLRAHKDVPFQPWLKGSLEGISPQEMRNVFSGLARFNKGVLLHVALQARADRKYANSDRAVRDEMKSKGFKKELILANVRGLKRLVSKLQWKAAKSEWADYSADCQHVGQDRDPKTRFITEVTAGATFGTVWDIGANDGHFSRLLAPQAEYVLAMDADELVLDRLYRRLRDEKTTKVQPLLVDLANPSPGLGWEGRERRTLADRGKPDLVLCLAVMHHLVIGRNIPTRRFVDWLASLGADVVLEFATMDDPMVRKLVKNKRANEVHADYSEEGLRDAIAGRFKIEREEALPSGHRTLYFLRAGS